MSLMPEPVSVLAGDGLLYHEAVSYHQTVTPISRFGASRAAALAARGAVQADAPPAPRNRLQRIAHQLGHKKKFDHSHIHRAPTMDRWGGICE
jgi:hypothetical protein